MSIDTNEIWEVTADYRKNNPQKPHYYVFAETKAEAKRIFKERLDYLKIYGVEHCDEEIAKKVAAEPDKYILNCEDCPKFYVLYSNEIVFRGHPDKVCDQISDALLDKFLEQDKDSRCGIEVVGGKGKIFVTGEVTSKAKVDVEATVNEVLRDVGYETNYEIINNLGQQSPNIAQGVDIGGAGDQGMMFGYACRETDRYLPKAMVILQELSMAYDELRKKDSRFLPDGKAQITGYYENGKLKHIKDFTISYQNSETDRESTDSIIIDLAIDICHKFDIIRIDNFHINPTGKFLIGGFDGDAGLTGRKIVVDNYQSFSNVGGGAFSGKDPTKVDRSAAYKARSIAIGCLNYYEDIDWCEVQLSYAIGMDIPLAIYVTTNKGNFYGNGYNLRCKCTPEKIISDLNLKNIKFYDTAKFGHFGNKGFSWEKGCEFGAENGGKCTV